MVPKSTRVVLFRTKFCNDEAAIFVSSASRLMLKGSSPRCARSRLYWARRIWTRDWTGTIVLRTISHSLIWKSIPYVWVYHKYERNTNSINDKSVYWAYIIYSSIYLIIFEVDKSAYIYYNTANANLHRGDKKAPIIHLNSIHSGAQRYRRVSIVKW